jgi:hypothetical protein
MSDRLWSNFLIEKELFDIKYELRGGRRERGRKATQRRREKRTFASTKWPSERERERERERSELG